MLKARIVSDKSLLQTSLVIAVVFYQMRGLTVPVFGHGFRIGDFLMVLATGAVGFHLFIHRVQPQPRSLLIGSILLVFSSFVSLLNAALLGPAMAEVARLLFVSGITIVLISWLAYRAEESLVVQLAKVIVGTAAFLSFLGVVGAVLFALGYRTPLVHDTLELRINPLFNDPNHFANYVNTAIFINILLIGEQRREWLWTGAFALNLTGLVLTLSCGGLLSGTVASGFVLLAALWSSRRLVVPTLVVLAVTGTASAGICGKPLIGKLPQLFGRVETAFSVSTPGSKASTTSTSTPALPQTEAKSLSSNGNEKQGQGMAAQSESGSQGQAQSLTDARPQTPADDNDSAPSQPGTTLPKPAPDGHTEQTEDIAQVGPADGGQEQSLMTAKQHTPPDGRTPSRPTATQPKPDGMLERVSNIRKYSAATSLGDKLDEWEAAYRGFKLHPWVGLGPDNFKFKYEELRSPTSRLGGIRPPHNTYLKVMAEQGIIGLAAFLVLVGGTVRLVWPLGSTTSARAYQVAVLGALVANLVQALVLDILSSRTLWLAITLVAVGRMLVQREQGKTTTTPE